MMRASRGFLGLPLLALLAVIVWLLVQLQPILTPFVLSALLAYLGDPLTDRIEAMGVGRTGSVCLVFLLMTLGVVLIILIMLPLLISQAGILIKGIPSAYAWFTQTVLPWLRETLDLPGEVVPKLEIKQTLLDHWGSVGRLMAGVAGYASSSTANLVMAIGNLVLIPVVTFYLLRDWDKLTPRLLNMLPQDWQGKGQELAKECDEVIGAFLRGQLLVMLALGIIYSVGLFIVGLDVAVAIGVFAGLFAIVPYLGTAVGILAATIAAWVQFGDWTALLGVAIVFSVGQMIESYLLTPWLVGDRIGLHPVAVIFAVLAGGQLAGFVGVLVGLPVAAVIAVLLRHVDEYYKATEFYTSDGEDGG